MVSLVEQVLLNKDGTWDVVESSDTEDSDGVTNNRMEPPSPPFPPAPKYAHVADCLN